MTLLDKLKALSGDMRISDRGVLLVAELRPLLHALERFERADATCCASHPQCTLDELAAYSKARAELLAIVRGES